MLPTAEPRSDSRGRLRPDAFAMVWHLLIDTGDPIDTGGSAVQFPQAFGVEEEIRGLLTLSGKVKSG